MHQVPRRVLAKRFGVSVAALHRHAQARAAILAAQKPSAVDLEALQRSESEGLLAQLVTQRARLQQQGELALELGDVKAAVAVENAITGNLTLVSRLLGQLVQVHEVRKTSILISADYLALRAAIVRALRPYPEAARAVGAALHELELEAAKDITEAKRPLVIEHQAEAVAL